MSAEPMPKAPSSIACFTSARIESSSAAVGGRSSKPITFSRIVVAPTNDPTFVAMPLRWRKSRYSRSVVH